MTRDPLIRHLLAAFLFLFFSPLGWAQVLFHGSAETGDLREFYAPNTTWGCSPRCNGGGLFDGSQPSPHNAYNGTVTDYQCFEKCGHTHVQTTMTAVLASSEGIPPHSGRYVIRAVHHSYCNNGVHGGPGCCSRAPGCQCTSATENSAGTRLFRWLESGDPVYFKDGLYYGIWVYFPQNYGTTHQTSNGRFWDLLQMKAAATSGHGANDPVWAIDLVNQIPGSVSPMRMELGFNGSATAGYRFAGPYTNSVKVGGQKFASASQPNLYIPIGKWFQIQVYLKQWPRDVKPHRGRIAVWQDGVLMFDLGGPDDPNGGIWTKYGDDLDGKKKANGVNQFSVNNYSDGAIPDPAVTYFDDMAISTAPINPGAALPDKIKK